VGCFVRLAGRPVRASGSAAGFVDQAFADRLRLADRHPGRLAGSDHPGFDYSGS